MKSKVPSSKFVFRGSIPISILALRFTLVVVLSVGSTAALGLDVLWVEESWELSVGEPDPDSSAPQVSMVMSPFADTESEYFVFALNHHSQPDYVPGGMQIQHWDGDEASSLIGPKEGCLDTSYEKVSWTQRLSADNGHLSFEIRDGTSTTWGTFGGNGHLRKSSATAASNINGYTPSISINESGVNYAGNRVSSLILTKLRWATSDGEVHEMSAPIDVDRDLLDP